MNPYNDLEKSIYQFVKSTLTNPTICAKFNKRTGSVADKATQWLDLGQIKMKAAQTGILCNISYFQIWAFIWYLLSDVKWGKLHSWRCLIFLNCFNWTRALLILTIEEKKIFPNSSTFLGWLAIFPFNFLIKKFPPTRKLGRQNKEVKHFQYWVKQLLS